MNDLISRQAAIDALRTHERKPSKKWFDNQLDIEWNNAIDICCYDIEDLPSAQPEKRTEKRTETHTCDCISREAAIDDLHGKDPSQIWDTADIEVWVNALPSAQPEQQWIPCSERLPEHGGRYLISVLDGVNRRTTVSPYLPRCKAWSLTGRMAYWKVIAWMPLPEPAKLGGD